MIERIVSPSTADYLKANRRAAWVGALSLPRIILEQVLVQMGLTPHASWLRWDDAIRELIVDSFELGTSSLIVGQRAKEKAVQREGRPAAILFGRCNRGWLYLEPDETVLISGFGAGKLEVMAESPLKLIERIPRLAGSMRAPLRLRLSPLCGARLAEALALPVAAEASDSVQTLWEKDGTLVVDEGLGDARSRSTTLAASTSGQLAAALRAVAGVEAVRVHIDTQTKENRLPVGEAPDVPNAGPEESLRLPVGFELEPVGGVVRLLGQGKNMEVEQLEMARGGVIGRLVVRGRKVISERFDVDAQPFKGAISEKAEKKLARKSRVDLRLRASEARLREILGVRAFPPVLALEERFGGLTLSGEQEGEGERWCSGCMPIATRTPPGSMRRSWRQMASGWFPSATTEWVRTTWTPRDRSTSKTRWHWPIPRASPPRSRSTSSAWVMSFPKAGPRCRSRVMGRGERAWPRRSRRAGRDPLRRRRTVVDEPQVRGARVGQHLRGASGHLPVRRRLRTAARSSRRGAIRTRSVRGLQPAGRT